MGCNSKLFQFSVFLVDCKYKLFLLFNIGNTLLCHLLKEKLHFKCRSYTCGVQGLSIRSNIIDKIVKAYWVNQFCSLQFVILYICKLLVTSLMSWCSYFPLVLIKPWSNLIYEHYISCWMFFRETMVRGRWALMFCTI